MAEGCPFFCFSALGTQKISGDYIEQFFLFVEERVLKYIHSIILDSLIPVGESFV